MKTRALYLALLAIAATGPALGGELQMATSEMNNADAAPGRTKTSDAIASGIRGRTVEANMAEKKQLRDLNRHEETQELQFQIQTMTSDLQNAENVRSGQ